MLAHEAKDPAPVPQRPPRQQAVIGDSLVLVLDDGSRDVPARPARAPCAVTEVDVLAVEEEALVEAAELVEQSTAQHQEAAEHPVGLDRLGRALVEVVVAALQLVRIE